jgi:hypothetical protein
LAVLTWPVWLLRAMVMHQLQGIQHKPAIPHTTHCRKSILLTFSPILANANGGPGARVHSGPGLIHWATRFPAR